jgi:hypothetical protein
VVAGDNLSNLGAPSGEISMMQLAPAVAQRSSRVSRGSGVSGVTIARRAASAKISAQEAGE